MEQVMDIKPRPNHRLYIEILRRMTPEERLTEALELSEFSKQLFIARLQHRFLYLPEEELKTLIKARLERCHNRNWRGLRPSPSANSGRG
jgi:hypothetical protein